jgi:hypothetical protein
MTHLQCPRCRLTITCRADYLTLTNCPRCLARAALATPLVAVVPAATAAPAGAAPGRSRPRRTQDLEAPSSGGGA